jgi:hypothetical protein
MTTRTPTTTCPYCGALLSAASNSPLEPDPRDPKPGDVTLCIECVRPLILTEGLGIRKPTDEEARDVMLDPDVRRLRNLLTTFHASRGVSTQ